MFSNISIRTKITSVVAFLLVALAGMGWLAIRNMQTINANTIEIATNWLPSIRTLGELRYGVIVYQNVVH
jgi:methyl-accepting chemotaxis protein